MTWTRSLWGIVAVVLLCGPGARAQTPIPPSPKDFVLAMSQGDQYEILSADVAAVRAQDPRVLAFAQEMVREHTRAAEDLRQAATSAGLPVPRPGMSSDEASLLGSLQGVARSDFDKAYARQQELAHASAVAVDDSFASAGGDRVMRKAAEAALPSLRDHLKQAQQLRAALGGS